MKANEKTIKDFANVDKFVNEVIKPIFPNAKLSNSMMVSSPDELATSFEGKLLSKDLFKGTNYEYKGDGKFLHFTTLFGLKGILDSGFLRMSEFGNLSDDKEINFASKIFENSTLFKFENEKYEWIKENIFCLSMCESNESTKRDDFMWEVYADKGKGVVIEFELTKKNPRKFVLGKIQYGDEKLNTLIRLKELAEVYILENPNFFPNNFSELLLELLSFHKVRRYEIENEVRLLLKVDKPKYVDHDLESIYKDINTKQEVKYFNKLFLKNRHPFLDFNYPLSDEKDAVFNEFPQIEIKNIILGYNLSIDKKVDLMDFFNKFNTDYKYDFTISQIFDEGIIREMK